MIYLTGDFRGTKESLKKLVNEDRVRKHLLIDIWQFYRAERLYLLKVIKEILSHANNTKHKHQKTFQSVLEKLKTKDLIFSLIKQLCSTIGCKYDKTSRKDGSKSFAITNGDVGNALPLNFKDDLGKAWVHFTLREQVELLQLILLYYNVCDSKIERSYDIDDVELFLTIFQHHNFGKKQKFIGSGSSCIVQAKDVASPELAEAVGHIECLIILFLFDLPTLTINHTVPKSKNNVIWNAVQTASKSESSSSIQSLDAFISSLGNVSDHAPIMLGWMLSHYLIEGEESLVVYRNLGERSVQLNVLKFLISCIQNETSAGPEKSIVASITYSIVYSLLSVLTTAFDPEQMGFKDDFHSLVCILLKEEFIAKDFWEQGFESGLGMYYAAELSMFPAVRRKIFELSSSLASAGTESAKNVFLLFSEQLETFAEHVEDVPGHVLQFLNINSDKTYPYQQWQLIAQARYPGGRIGASVGNTAVVISNGTKATSDGKFYQWQLAGYDGLQYLFGEVDVALAMVSTGIKNLSKHKIEELEIFTKLYENLLRNRYSNYDKNTKESHEKFEKLAANASFLLIEKFSQFQQPPINLLANCITSLSLIAQRTHRSQTVWEKLEETGIFPYITRSHTLLNNATKKDKFSDLLNTANINHGLVGSILAQQECVQGLYPLTMSFLELLLVCVKKEMRSESFCNDNTKSNQEEVQIPATMASVLYIIHDIFPSFQQWGFSIPSEREKFGQKILQICYEIINVSREDSNSSKDRFNEYLREAVTNALVAPAPNQTLLGIAATGDKVIQSFFESQPNAEAGIGCELTKLVNLSIKVLDSIIKVNASLYDKSKMGIDRIIGGSVTGAKPHLLLTVANYVHHLQSCELPRSAVNLLSTIASVFPMSMLACFGNEAQAIRDILLRRLESKTEDILFKIAIVRFFTSCVESQPGLIQLLLGAKDINIINVNAYIKDPEEKTKLSSTDEKSNEAVSLLDDNGCLKTILETLNEMKKVSDSHSSLTDLLHVVIVDFLYNLWSHQRILAVTHLKRQETFWADLTAPLFDNPAQIIIKPRLNGCILRIIASEIYTYRGDIDKPLASILEKFFDDKADFLKDWCTLVINRLFENDETESNVSSIDESTCISSKTSKEDDAIFLLGSWKTFLVVLSKDQPIAVSPKQCNLIIDCLIKSIRHHIRSNIYGSASQPSYLRITTSLAETSLILMRRWQTKCADNMQTFCAEQGKLIEDVSKCQLALHPRFISAVIASTTTTLKFSQFKFKEPASKNKDERESVEEQTLLRWLPAIVKMSQQTINILIDSLLSGANPPPKIMKLSESPEDNQKIDILIVGLLRNLVVRLSVFSESTCVEGTSSHSDSRRNNWYPALHEVALVQTILSGTHHLIRFRQRPDFIQANLSLLLTLARTQDGCNAILSNDLSQLLWLPLSSIKQGAPKEWIPVFVESIHLVSTLLRVGGQQAIDNAISFFAFLEEQLLSFLSTKSGTAGNYAIGVEFFLQENQVKLTSATASLVSLMMDYYKQWQLKHSSSLNNAYQSMCALLHTSVCLLIRPSVLKMLIGQNNKDQDKTDASLGQVSADIQKARRRLSSKGAAAADDSFLAFDECGNSNDGTTVFDNIQNKLLDIVGSCLKMLHQLSPDLIKLLTDALVDHASYIELLQMGFSSPTFEHDEVGVLTYGTIISISNVCIKYLARTPQSKEHTSPPSTRSASTDSPESAYTGKNYLNP